jgi:hypothetical protein
MHSEIKESRCYKIHWLQDEGRKIVGNMNRLSGKTGSESGRIEMEPGKIESVKDSDMIWIDWRLPILECIRDPGKTTDKKVKRQVLSKK